MHDDVARVERRAARFVTERLRPAVYRRQQPLTVVSWDTPGEPVDFGTAYAATYAPCVAGPGVGPTVGHDLVPVDRGGAGRLGGGGGPDG